MGPQFWVAQGIAVAGVCRNPAGPHDTLVALIAGRGPRVTDEPLLGAVVSWFHLVSYSQGPQMHFSGTDCWVLIPLLLMVTSLLTTIISSRSDTISTVMLAVRLLLFLTLTVVLGLTIAGQMELHQIWFWTKGNAVARWILVTTSFLVWALQIPLVIVMWKRRSQLRDASQPRDKNHQSEFWVDNRPNGMAGIDIAK
ncbi:unnamed protein product (mitochondrion) [Plasmodiophora brassicae]|uniref:Uncharacterized protein n=1 Tax=Plasmodiophora brassicae TaxID=37360 RepID=A0A3P3YF06_PLABS|nr:unnamed protein product [Plasmodiophora brassicae]